MAKVSKSLISSGCSLSRFVLETTLFSKGEFFTYLKNDLLEKKLYEFSNGGVGSRNKDIYINLVHQELISSNGGCCFFDCIDQDYNPSSPPNLTNKIEIHYQNAFYSERMIWKAILSGKGTIFKRL